jgi:hypothetical protein
MPKDNEIPKSYNRLQNAITIPKYQSYIHCNKCNKNVDATEVKEHKCANEYDINEDFIRVYSMDINSQISRVITENYSVLIEYRSIFLKNRLY